MFRAPAILALLAFLGVGASANSVQQASCLLSGGEGGPMRPDTGWKPVAHWTASMRGEQSANPVADSPRPERAEARSTPEAPKRSEADAKPAGFFLGEPEVIKSTWNTRNLLAKDIDKDGRNDLCLINNGQARIEIYYRLGPGEKPGKSSRSIGKDRWEPQLEDARFEREKITIGTKASALAIGDVDGDGAADLVYTNDRDELVVLKRAKASGWDTLRTFKIDDLLAWTQTLRVRDIDGDGRDDIALIKNSALVLVFQDKDGKLKPPVTYPLATDEPGGLTVLDLNGDGRNDLYYGISKSKRYFLAVRFQQEDGGFSAEQLFKVDEPRSLVVPVRGGAAEKGKDKPSPLLGFVSNATGFVQLAGIGVVKKEAGSEDSLAAHIFPLPHGESKATPYAVADFNGDGMPDVIAADSAGAQVWLYPQQSGGSFGRALAFPSLAGITQLAPGNPGSGGARDLFMLTPKEESIGISSFTKHGRLSYPKLLPVKANPVAIDSADLDGDGRLELVYLFYGKTEKGFGILREDGKGGWTARTEILAQLKSQPTAVRGFDINQDGRTDLLIFSEYEPLRICLQDEDGGFNVLEDIVGLPKNLLKSVSPASVTGGDLDGDGKPELLIADKTFARGIRLKKDRPGEGELVDQFNAPRGVSGLLCALATDITKAPGNEILLITKRQSDIHLLERDANGIFRHKSTSHLGMSELEGTSLADLDGDKRTDILFFAKDHFRFCSPGRPLMELKNAHAYETDLKGVQHRFLVPGDLNGDGIDDLAAIDSVTSFVLEVLLHFPNAAKRKWESALFFKIFEADPLYRGKRGGAHQPHEAIIAELTNDSKNDIALLIHDRILIYPQE